MIWDVLHAGLGWPAVAALLVTSFASSLITTAFGIGGGLVMLAVMATLLPPAVIIPVHGLVQLGSNFGRMVVLLRYVQPAVILPFLVGAVAGVALGGAFVVQMDPGLLQIGVGLFVLWSISFRPPAIMARSAVLAGTVSSFLTMFFGGTGPFVAAYVKTLDFDRMRHVATLAALMSLQHLLKSLVFGFLGFAFAQWVGLVALLIACGFLGTLVGRMILIAIDEKRFRIILNILLAVIAARLIVSGLLSLRLW